MKDKNTLKQKHNLRAPLTSIKWFSELLESPETGQLNDKQKKCLQEIKKATKKVIEMTK